LGGFRCRRRAAQRTVTADRVSTVDASWACGWEGPSWSSDGLSTLWRLMRVGMRRVMVLDEMRGIEVRDECDDVVRYLDRKDSCPYVTDPPLYPRLRVAIP
jgi:hypothetical protein